MGENMKKMIVPAAAAIVFAAASAASAQLMYDPFNYGSNSTGSAFSNPTGTPANGGQVNPRNGQTWFDQSTNATANESQLLSGSLTAPTGFPASTGDSVEYPANGLNPNATQSRQSVIGLFG